ncbi:MAG: sigma 54-interacting transcriptional regulator [Sedimentisphaerales bacterium]|nr:sigma 54-interacting transcriptional regulator [Sedimentisphaerales bacterium]
MTEETTFPSNAPDNKHLHTGELATLYRISQVLATGVLQRQMLLEVLDLLDRELGMAGGTIMLLSPDGSELMIEVAHDLSEKGRQATRYQMGEGITGHVVQTGQPISVPKISQEPRFLNRTRRKRRAQQETSFICVPISIGRNVVGALSVERPYDPEILLEEQQRVLSIVASMIANDVRARRQAKTQQEALEQENLRLRNELEDRFRPENIIGNSGAMREVYRAIHQVAPSDTTVLIRGKSGTGKELVAHAIHYSSPRANGPFIKVNCAALSENLLESELFGHEKGAFTGAIQTRKGRIEEADGGTLFLDEIGDFSLTTQVKLLRVLQERQFERVGSNQPRSANTRIITATNRDLEKAVADGSFRQDLYYRINVFPVFLPALRDRKDDILLLADYFVERYSNRMGKDVRRISTPAINMMVAYHWPGNVRELENCIERAVLLSTDNVIHSHHLPPTLQTSDATDTFGVGSLAERVSLYERDIIVDTLKRTQGNLAAAARELGTTPRIIRYKVTQLDIVPERYKSRALDRRTPQP